MNIKTLIISAFLLVLAGGLTFGGEKAFAEVDADSSNREISAHICDRYQGEFGIYSACRSQVESELRDCGTGPAGSAQEATSRRNCRQRIANGILASDIERSNLETLRELEQSREGSSNFEGDCSGDMPGALHPDNCGITAMIRFFADVLAVLVGVVVVMMIVIGGIQYSSAGANPQAVSAAKKKISQALIALFVYFFLFAFLQWLVPGGVF